MQRIQFDRRQLWRKGILLACSAFIVWLGFDMTGQIGELYNGLCEVQGPGLASLLYNGNRLGYCTGIEEYLAGLRMITVLAAGTAPTALSSFWSWQGAAQRSAAASRR